MGDGRRSIEGKVQVSIGSGQTLSVESVEREGYCKHFSIPEMLNTFKVLSSKLYKSFLFLCVIIYFILKSNAHIKLWEMDLSYKGDILLISFLYFGLILSLVHNLNKLFILYRQIDEEIKIVYRGKRTSNVGSFRADQINSNDLTGFIISNNFFTDFIILGENRLPSLKRLMNLNVFILSFSTLIMTIILNDYFGHGTANKLYLMIFISFIINAGIFYKVCIRNFITRTSYLFITDKGKMILSDCSSLIHNSEAIKNLLKSLSLQRPVSIKKESIASKFNTEVYMKLQKFKSINGESVFNDDSWMNLIKQIILVLDEFVNSLDEEENKILKESSPLDIKNFMSGIENIKENYKQIDKKQKYKYSLNYFSINDICETVHNYLTYVWCVYTSKGAAFPKNK
jgi:hypothetical protein